MWRIIQKLADTLLALADCQDRHQLREVFRDTTPRRDLVPYDGTRWDRMTDTYWR